MNEKTEATEAEAETEGEILEEEILEEMIVHLAKDLLEVLLDLRAENPVEDLGTVVDMEDPTDQEEVVIVAVEVLEEELVVFLEKIVVDIPEADKNPENF